MSNKIQRVLNEVGVKVAIKPHLTIRKLLPSLKDPLDYSEKSCLFYQVPCRDCSFVYIGQTKRDLKSRLDEHKRAIKNQRLNLSALCEHSITIWTTLYPGQKPKFWNWKPTTETTIPRKLTYKCKTACHEPKQWQFIPCSLFRLT